MKKILILLCFIFLLSGCYDYVEIDDLVIISGMLLDYKDNNYVVTSQVIENESKTKIKIYTTECLQIDECIYELSKISNKDIFLSHLKVLILTESVINNGKDYYDYFLRDTKSKMNFYIYYVDDKYKDEILNIYKEDSGSALYIKDLMEFNNKIFSSSTPVSFLDLIYKKLEYGIEPIYPNLKVNKNNDEKILFLENLITFNNKKEKIVLNDIDGITYNMLSNKLIKTIITIPCDENNFSLIINDVKTDYNWKKSILKINTNLKGKMSSYTCKYDLGKSDNIEKLNSIVNQYIKKNINDLITKQIENNIDFLGFGLYIYKHDKNYFDFKNNNWNDNLKNLKIDIKVNTTISSIGEMRK